MPAQIVTRRAPTDHVGCDIATAGGPRNPPADRRDDGRDLAAVEAFLDDGERIEQVRSEARAEAERRATE